MPVAEQSDLLSEVNECCLCGLAVGSGEVEPGNEVTMTITVHDEVCPNGPMFSMAAMIGEDALHGTYEKLSHTFKIVSGTRKLSAEWLPY